MPLVKVYPKAEINATFLTCGPWSDRNLARKNVLHFAQTYFKGMLKRSATVAEISDNGYKHVHLAMEFVTKTQKVYKFKFALLEYIQSDDFPLGIWDPNETHKFNSDAYLIPRTEPDKQGRTNFDHIAIKYMSKPTKDKEVDEDMLQESNPNALPDWFAKMFDEQVITFNCGKKITIPQVMHGDIEKKWNGNCGVGYAMSQDYKFYQKQSDYLKRHFDKYWTESILWKTDSEKSKTNTDTES